MIQHLSSRRRKGTDHLVLFDWQINQDTLHRLTMVTLVSDCESQNQTYTFGSATVEFSRLQIIIHPRRSTNYGENSAEAEE